MEHDPGELVRKPVALVALISRRQLRLTRMGSPGGRGNDQTLENRLGSAYKEVLYAGVINIVDKMYLFIYCVFKFHRDIF